MKPLPILLTAAGLAVAAASTYVWMGSNFSAAPASRAASTTQADTPGAGGDEFSGTPDRQNGGAVLSSFAEKARLGRSFRAGDAADATPTPALASATSDDPASEAGGISTDYLRNPRRHAGGDGMLPTSRGPNGQPAGRESGPVVASSIGFGALADTSFGTGQEAASGILAHPGIVPPAAPRLSGAMAVPPSNDGSLANAVPPGFNVGGTQATDPSNTPVQRGGRPAWPTGPFTPEQELYRAQIGSANFDLWLTDEAKKQRPDLQ